MNWRLCNSGRKIVATDVFDSQVKEIIQWPTHARRRLVEHSVVIATVAVAPDGGRAVAQQFALVEVEERPEKRQSTAVTRARQVCRTWFLVHSSA